MKRIQTAAAFLMAAVLLTGCGSVLSGTSAAISTDKISIEAYKGLKILPVEEEEVTDEAVEENIRNTVAFSSDRVSFTDRPGEPDDYAVLGIECEIEGARYEYLCYDSTELMIPHAEGLDMESDDLLSMVASKAEGHMVGDTFAFDSAIPNGYSVFPDIAGRTAHWTVEVKELVSYVDTEFNDAFVMNQGIDGVTTVEEYRAYIKADMQKYAAEAVKYDLRDEVLQALLRKTRVTGDLSEEIEKYLEDYRKTYKENAELLNVSYEDYIAEYIGCPVEEFEEQIRTTADQFVKEDLAIQAIADAEDLHVTEESYKAELDAYAQAYYYGSGEELEREFGKESIIASMERDHVLDYLIEQAEYVDELPDEESAEESSAADSSHGKLLYVTIGLAAALVIVVVILAVVLLRNRRRNEEER